mmetsp:Transcript_102514/g.313468  ORF Transcript_102514/g.313468 Transcript_102514/m.313468 type:complete len:200 (-) Transcript_102514:68-667(-)
MGRPLHDGAARSLALALALALARHQVLPLVLGGVALLVCLFATLRRHDQTLLLFARWHRPARSQRRGERFAISAKMALQAHQLLLQAGARSLRGSEHHLHFAEGVLLIILERTSPQRSRACRCRARGVRLAARHPRGAHLDGVFLLRKGCCLHSRKRGFLPDGCGLLSWRKVRLDWRSIRFGGRGFLGKRARNAHPFLL